LLKSAAFEAYVLRPLRRHYPIHGSHHNSC
jgi:hypothetical protein